MNIMKTVNRNKSHNPVNRTCASDFKTPFRLKWQILKRPFKTLFYDFKIKSAKLLYFNCKNYFLSLIKDKFV